jgi:predicted phosphodiesterase
MDKWIFPTVIILLLIIIFWPPFLIIIAIILVSWWVDVMYFMRTTPPPYLSITAELNIVINWFSKGTTKTALIIYSQENSIKKSVDKTHKQVYQPQSSIQNEFTASYTVNSVTLPKLTPNARYYYEIVGYEHENITENETETEAKKIFHGNDFWFIQPTAEAPSRPLKIVTFGDIQPQCNVPPLLQWMIMHHVAKQKPDLFLFLGDHTNEGTVPELWRFFYHLLGKICRNTPMFGVPGNHDTKLKRKTGPRMIQKAYQTHVNYPEPKSRYFLKLYGINLFAFDFASGFAKTGENYQLFEKHIKDLNKEDWTFLLWHSSPHNSLTPGEQANDIRKNLIPVLDEKSKAVWFGGHEHSYQKFKVKDTYYITTGATSSFHKHWKNEEYLEKLVKEYHFVTLDVDKGSIDVKAINIHNKLIDEFQIQK